MEDFEIYSDEDKRYIDFQKTELDKRIDFLKQRIKELEDEGKERRVIQSRVMSEFKKTFGAEINLRRLNGKWLAKGWSINGEKTL